MKTQTSTPTFFSFRMSPGMKMLGARGREGIKRYRRRNERFLRNEIQYFQEIIQTFQNVETYTNPQPGQPMGRRQMAGDRRGSTAQGPVSKSEAEICPGEQDRVNPGPAPPPHRTGRRLQGTKGQQPPSSSLARMSASATSTPVHPDDSKFFTKKIRSDSMSAPSPRYTKQTIS